MKIQSILYLVIIGFLFSSCSNVVYQTAVPQNISQLNCFPSEIQGQYVDDDHDTLLILADRYQYGNSDDLFNLKGQLDDELILKELDGYYFLNFKNSDGFWEMIAAHRENQNLTLFFINAKDKEDIKIINSIIENGKVRSVRSNGKYIINPSGSDILELLKQENICEKTILTKID
ncbi:MAG: hypothetical protein GQ527_12715 [Bacteroidales bacterium]|nr:hypothetical protein [Bacteroidales bacterium]